MINEKIETAQALADVTTCMVPVPDPKHPGHFKPCGQRFTSGVPILGAKQSRLNQYMEGLGKHLHDKHPEVGMQMAQIGAAFMEMLFLRNFKTTDAELTEMLDRVRWQVHQQTLKARYPDRNLNEQALELSQELARTVSMVDHDAEGLMASDAVLEASFEPLLVAAFRSIRDALEEPGKYPVPVPESSKVLV